MSADVDKRLFGPGVYHLIADGEVVYVGVSTCLANRIGTWCPRTSMYTTPIFDSVRAYFTDSHEEAIQLEEQHIAQLQPKHNRAGVTCPYVGPAWREKGGYSVKGDNKDRVFTTRLSFLSSRPGDFSASVIRKLKLLPNGGGWGDELLLQLKFVGFPAPDYADGHGRPRWWRQTVFNWLDSTGPFDDERTAS